MESKKRTILIIAIFAVVLAIIGGTLAYWIWTTNTEQQTNVVFTISQDFSCAADGGGDITSNDALLVPTTCTDSEYKAANPDAPARVINRTVTVTPTLNKDDLNIYMDLWLDVNDLGTGLSESENFKYALTTTEGSCSDGVVASGTFQGRSNGSKVRLLHQKVYSATITETYYLYIWLDAAETSSSTMNQTFNLSLGGSCTDDPSYKDSILNGADPVLDDGMIPVTISENGVATTADTTSEWYNYENKEWANAVLVSDDSRSTYRNTTGVTVSQDDILAYYVWIPRYKYKIWTLGTDSSPQTIDIVFEDEDTVMSNGSTIDAYRTHPAFWWDDNSDGVVDSGETVAGIWVGKFETTGSATTPTILPNKSSLRSQNVSTQFATSQKFSATGNAYGLSNTSTNAHMMKNSEWGAVAYLSHSVYGINGEIYINNSSGYFTGRSGGNVGGSVATVATQFSGETSTNQYNSYGYYTWTGQTIAVDGTVGDYAEDRTLGTKASSTGNVTGVYDLSGGAWEYVMGNYNDTTGSSGFSTFPASKYYDKYTTTSSTTACNGGVCFGHALSETSGWYGDYADFVYSDNPWFVRGGGYHNGANAGAFSFGRDDGNSGSNRSWRSVLVIGFDA